MSMTDYKVIERGSGTHYVYRWAYITINHCDVWNGWLVIAYDENGDQVGESEFAYLKVDAIDIARAYLDSDRCDAIHIFTKTGTHSQTIGAA